MEDEKKQVSRGRLVLFILITLVISFLVGYGGLAILIPDTPAWKPEDLGNSLNTEIMDNKGVLVAVLHGLENREPLPETVPAYAKQAFVAVEDERFYSHNGVDVEGILRAMVANFRQGRIAEGGSTITQQLVKNSILSTEKTYERKIKEALVARQIETKYSKGQILDMYLTSIYFGNGAYGLESAARTYFGKSSSQLTVAEAALLAGLVKSPARYSPSRHADQARVRMETVLTLMKKNNIITEDQYQQALTEGYTLKAGGQSELYNHSNFVDYVVEEASKRLGVEESKIYEGGLHIYSTLDDHVQESAEKVWFDAANFPAPASDGLKVEAAIAVLDYHTGEIKALVGGRDEGPAKRGFNRATDGKRQPGSTFKPIAAYGPALEEKYPPYMVLKDEPVEYGSYSPKNYGGGYRGDMRMSTAIKYSVNVWAVKLLDLIGVEKGYQFASKLGFNLVPQDKGLAMALGGLTNGVAPLQMANGYGAFANQGMLVNAHVISKITDSTGQVLYQANITPKQVMKPQTAYVMTDLLQDVVKGGTGTKARLHRPVAGKTGTTQLPTTKEFKGTNGNKDAWFVGYTPELVAAVWLGYDRTDKEHYLKGVVGGSFPAMLWRKVMEQALEGVPEKPFPKYKGKLEYRHDVRTKLEVPPKAPEVKGPINTQETVQENGGTAETGKVGPGVEGQGEAVPKGQPIEAPTKEPTGDSLGPPTGQPTEEHSGEPSGQ